MIQTIDFDRVIIPLLGLCLLLLLVLLILLLVQHCKTREKIRMITDQLKRMSDAAQLAEQEAANRQRDELVQNLHQLNDSLISTFGQISRSQTEQVNAIIRQSYDNAQAAEQRQQAMQRMIDENLQRSDLRMEAFRKTVDENMRLLREENSKRLTEMRATVDEKLTETLEKRLNSSFSQVSSNSMPSFSGNRTV